jgi:hypothetical protein
VGRDCQQHVKKYSVVKFSPQKLHTTWLPVAFRWRSRCARTAAASERGARTASLSDGGHMFVSCIDFDRAARIGGEVHQEPGGSRLTHNALPLRSAGSFTWSRCASAKWWLAFGFCFSIA